MNDRQALDVLEAPRAGAASGFADALTATGQWSNKLSMVFHDIFLARQRFLLHNAPVSLRNDLLTT